MTDAAQEPPEQLPEYRCEECLKGPEKTTFTLDAEGAHARCCDECYQRKHYQQWLAEQEAERKGNLTELFRATIRQTVDLPQVDELTAKLCTLYGGIDSIAQLTYDQLQGLLDAESPYIRLKALQFLHGLLRAGMSRQQTEWELSGMTTDELNTLANRYLKNRFGPVATLPATGPDGEGT